MEANFTNGNCFLGKLLSRNGILGGGYPLYPEILQFYSVTHASTRGFSLWDMPNSNQAKYLYFVIFLAGDIS